MGVVNPREQLLLRRQWLRDRKRYVALAVGFIAAVMFLSFLPEDDKVVLHTKGRFHSLGHSLIFGLAAYLASRTSRTRGGRFLMFLASLAFGLVVEAGEGIIFHGSLEWNDVVADSIGVVLGTVAAILVAPKFD